MSNQPNDGQAGGSGSGSGSNSAQPTSASSAESSTRPMPGSSFSHPVVLIPYRSPYEPSYSRTPVTPQYNSATSPFITTTPTRYNPTSPRYSPTAATGGGLQPIFTPTSPRYSPTSPTFFAGNSPSYSPVSPAWGAPTSFAAVAAAPPSPTNARRPSFQTSAPSPRVHRANTGTGPMHWMGAAEGGGDPAPGPQSTSTSSSPSFLRPPYIEHTAFRHLFKQDMFSRNAQPQPSTSTTPSAKPTPAAVPAGTVRRINPYSTTHIVRSSGTSTPSSDGEGDSAYVAATARAMTSSVPVTAPKENEKVVIRPEDETFTLPTRWNDADRHTSLQVSLDGRDLTFLGSQHGHISPDKEDAASARTTTPISPACGVYYYEVEVLNKGTRGHIGIGFATKYAQTGKLPGWEDQSWGYHGDAGCAFFNGQNKNFGPRFSTGDIIGCGVDFSVPKIFYTKNGLPIGTFPFPIISSPLELYPFVGLRSSRESIQANFGQYAFKFDIEAYVLEKRNHVWRDIQKTSLEWTVDSKGLEVKAEEDKPAIKVTAADSFSLPVIPTTNWADLTSPASASSSGSEGVGDDVHSVMKELVLEYLVQSGYPGTATLFKQQCDEERGAADRASQDVQDADARRLQSSTTKKPPSKKASGSQSIGVGMDVQDALVRRRIMDSIRRGDVDAALRDLETTYPVLVGREGDSDGGVRFQLRCRRLVELVLDAASEGAIAATNGHHPALRKQPSMDDAMDLDHPPLSYRQQQKQKQKQNGVSAMDRALAYGQSLHADYGNDKRPAVQALLKQATSLVAYVDPLEAGDEEVKRFAGQEARDGLARRVNEAILESQRRKTDSILERTYVHAFGVVRQLAVMGEGKVAFADVEKEFR